MNRLKFLRLSLQALCLTALALLAGCGSSSQSTPTQYSLLFQAHPQINQSAPLKVRVLWLKSDADFMSADFYSLQNNAQSVLGANLLDSEQFFLMPGQTNKKIVGQNNPGARYIAIMAEYQALDGKRWRLSLPLPQPSGSRFYEVWKGSDDELHAEVIADVSGIRVVKN